LPTKDEHIRTLQLATIRTYVDHFLSSFAKDSHLTFFVTAIGTGLAGYSHEEIAPMFKDAPDNCILPIEWKKIIGDVS